GLRHPTGGPPRGPGRGQGAHDPLPGAHHRGSGPRAAAHRRRSARRTARPLRAHGSPSRRRGGMRINIVTIFPDFFEGPLGLSIPRRAADAGLVEYRTVDLRDYTHDIHRTVDDVPYGGGAGMVMKPEPFFEAVEDLAPAGPIVLLSARGRPFRHEDAVRLSLASELTLLCGHYKDVDQRVADHLATDEISLGDFVLSGGEIGALAITYAVVRHLTGALGDHDPY